MLLNFFCPDPASFLHLTPFAQAPIAAEADVWH
jgi:hypothetical protein